jgi:hypothetical protein
MKSIPEEFATIPLNNHLSGPCSPVLGEEDMGVRLRAPEAVILEEDMALPVCGSYRFPAAFWNRFHSLRYEMCLVIIDADTHSPRITNLTFRDFVPAPRKFKESDLGFDEKTAAGWFNADLFFYLPEIPRKIGAYHVFAQIGGEKSNVVTIRIKKP